MNLLSSLLAFTARQIGALRTQADSNTSRIETSEGNITDLTTTVNNTIVANSNSKEQLWSGELFDGTATLSKNISNFDFIDIEYKQAVSGSVTNKTITKRIPAVAGSYEINDFAVDYTVPSIDFYKQTLTLSATSLVAAQNYDVTGVGGSDTWNKQRGTYQFSIVRVLGVKLGSASPSELTDIRVGADGVTYNSAGAAVRGQLSDLKSDIVSLGTDGTYVVDLTWEHGGIDNATGELNNEGSTTRSRVSSYMECADYDCIYNDSATQNAWVIYYDENKNFMGADSVLYSNSPKDIQDYAYFRLDFRRGLEYTYQVRLYKKATFGVESTNIPVYWVSSVATAETAINGYLASDECAASFAFVTDTHVGNNRGYSGALLNKVMTDCHIPVWFHGGDAVTGSGIISASSLVGEMNADFEQFKEIENIGLRAIGNHDPAFGVSSNYDSNLRNPEINHYYHGADREKYLQIYGEKKGYFYKDIHKDKLRCICLDIIPYESQVNSSDLVTGSNKMWYHQFGSEQLEWFANVLANTPNGYSVVVCSHIAPVSLAELKTIDNSWEESVPIDYLQARKIAEAYALKSSYSFVGTIQGDTTGDSYNINVDFSSAHGDFVCFFCGHTHKDFNLTLDNVLIVGTANDSMAVSTNASSYAPSKTVGTDTEQIIDFFCVLPTSRTIAVVRLGAYLSSNGKVRTFTY